MSSMVFSQTITSTTPAMSSDTTEHVALGSLPSIQDANLLREAALKSRRARKQAALSQSRQEPSVLEPRGAPVDDEDTPMDDMTTHTKADTEDGEILEGSQTGGSSVSGLNAREETPRPLSDVSSKHITAPTGTEELRYVRPGLKMTARDLEEAKRLILDLLGLGVKPEYLIDCGVSPQCIAVCFYEMNLRFPLNLDRRQIDLPPAYNLEKHMKDSQRREQIIRQRDRTKAASTLSNSVAASAPIASGPSESKEVTSPSSSQLVREKSLENTPQAIRKSVSPTPPLNDKSSDPTSTRSLSSRSTSYSGSTPTVEPSTEEDQERMELLARKAAMESINRKRAAKRSAQPARLEIQDVESAVDALLASVRMDSASSAQSQDRSSDGGDSASASTGEPLPDYDSDAMVEDELDVRSPSLSDPGTDDKPVEPTLIFGHQRNLSPDYIAPGAPAPIPSPKLPASRVRFDAPARSSSLPLQPAPVTAPVVARRSRPIASDFIDQVPPRPAGAFQSEPDRGAPLKRKRSFVDPSVWPKRLVIDLDSSDGEDEDETEASTRLSVPSSSKPTPDRAPSRNGSHDKQTAQMLLEKELQIKAMMTRIKMRELQKKKSASGTATPASSLIVEDIKSQTPTAVFASAGVSVAPSTANITPLSTPKSEVPAELALDADTEKVSTLPEGPDLPDDSLETTTSKIDKGKGKAIEVEEGGTQDDSMNIPTVARVYSRRSSAASPTDNPTYSQATTNPGTQVGPSTNTDNNKPVPTHFKAYASPLIGFTSPSLQRSEPTDRQLSTMYWVSSTAGQWQDVNRQLCQYEFPSGICRDQGCKDIHTRDFGASDDEIWKTTTSMFPNAGPEGLNEIVARVRQSVQAHS